MVYRVDISVSKDAVSKLYIHIALTGRGCTVESRDYTPPPFVHASIG